MPFFSKLRSSRAAISANILRNREPSSTIILLGIPVYTLDQHSTIASQTVSVVILVRNRAAEKRVASSTMCSAGFSSSYKISMYARALNITIYWPSDTWSLNGALRVHWHGSHLLATSCKRSSVCGVTASILAFCRRLYDSSAERCAKLWCSLRSCAVV